MDIYIFCTLLASLHLNAADFKPDSVFYTSLSTSYAILMKAYSHSVLQLLTMPTIILSQPSLCFDSITRACGRVHSVRESFWPKQDRTYVTAKRVLAIGTCIGIFGYCSCTFKHARILFRPKGSDDADQQNKFRNTHFRVRGEQHTQPTAICPLL